MDDLDSLRLALEAERHNHRKDNAYMVEVKHRLLDALELIARNYHEETNAGRIAREAIKDVSHGNP